MSDHEEGPATDATVRLGVLRESLGHVMGGTNR